MTPSWEALALSLCLLLVLSDSSPAESGGGGGGRHNRRAAAAAAGKRKTIHLAGIFPINGIEGWQGGQACEPAARMALNDVNSNPTLLPGYQLKLHWNDSGCDSGKGAAVMYDLLYNKPQKVIMLAGCSAVCTTVAGAAQYWNLVTVCYGASSPALSNRQRFPTLFRTHPSATVHNPTRIKVFQRYNWSKVSILQETEEVFSTTLDDLESRAKAAGIRIATRQSFLRDPGAAVSNLKRQDARIIVGLFYAKAARKVLCEIYKQKMYGKKYVWFFIGWYEDDWFSNEKYLDAENINCTARAMREAAEGHFTTEAQMWNQDNRILDSGKTVDGFRSRLKALLRSQPRYAAGLDKGIMPEGYLEAPLAYDAIWAIALALNRTIQNLAARGQTIDDYNYENKEIGEIILEEIGDTKFDGISGSVAFNEDTGDRIAWTKVEQLQEGMYQVVAYYDMKTDNLSLIRPPPYVTDRKDKVVWVNDKVPQDRTIVTYELRVVNLWLYLSMVLLSFGGCGIALAFIWFNFKYAHRRIVQHSHPSCNNLMLLGIILCLLAIIPGGLDGRFVSPSVFPVACSLGTWLLTLGFSLSYGAMFSKIWRVHRITRMTKEEGKTAQVVPWKLWAAVAGLLAIDVILLLVWTLVDPLSREVRNFPKLTEAEMPNPEADIEIVPQLEHCKSRHHNVWLGILYAYKGLQLVLGLFLAYETRSQKVQQINDSRLVGMATYNVVILCLITAPVMLVIGDQQNAAFCFVSMANLFCCFLSMGLVFVPKILFIRKHAHDPREREEDKKEEERRYKEIVQENELMKKKVQERTDYLSGLRKRAAALCTQSQNQTSAVQKSASTATVIVTSVNGSASSGGGGVLSGGTGASGKPKPCSVSFSQTRTTVTINEEPSITSDATPTSTSPTTGCSSTPPPPHSILRSPGVPTRSVVKFSDTVTTNGGGNGAGLHGRGGGGGGSGCVVGVRRVPHSSDCSSSASDYDSNSRTSAVKEVTVYKAKQGHLPGHSEQKFPESVQQPPQQQQRQFEEHFESYL